MLKPLLLSSLSGCILLADAQEHRDEIILKLQRYHDNNGVSVGKPLVKVQKTLGGKSALGVHFTLDAVTGASRMPDYPALSVDAVTSASKSEIRRELGGSISHRIEQTQVALSGQHSSETDYFSRSGSLDLRQDLFQHLSTIRLRYTLFDDDYRPKVKGVSYVPAEAAFRLADTRIGEGGKKTVHNIALGWTQTLGRRTLGMVSGTGVFSRGYLGRPYYLVVVEDTALSVQDPAARGGMLYHESLPDRRESYSGLVLLRQHYPGILREGAVQLQVRAYWDTWGVSSLAISGLVTQYLLDGLFIQLGYRLYNQQAADFYRDRYTQRNVRPGHPEFLSYMTVDPRLSRFTSHLQSAKAVFLIRNFIKPNTGGLPALFPARLNLEVERYARGTHGEAEVRRRRYERYGKSGLVAWTVRGGLVFYY